MYIYAFQEGQFIGYKQSFTRSIAFFQRNSSTHFLEDEVFNGRDIINNLVYYEDEQDEVDSLRGVKIYARIQLSNKSEEYFLNNDTDSKMSLDFK
ncbi:hypothetical protein TNCV_2023791 [Trichonephila clavipes]|nr:hypothetical protein TNCV_2023791 [Trichonephila clavipes]